MTMTSYKPTINFIGAGKLGKTIAKLIVSHQAGHIQAICETTRARSTAAITFIGHTDIAALPIAQLPPADITFVTTPDDVIQHCCEKLAMSPQLKENSIVLHCSGSLSSDVLSAVKNKHCLIASAHPMRSFADPAISVTEYQNTYCAIEGDQAAVEPLFHLFQIIGSIPFAINRQEKKGYHLAGVFASNYLVTLYETAFSCFKKAGVADETAKQAILNLMQSTITNLNALPSAKDALTGPIKRHDMNTLAMHIHALSTPQLTALYKMLGLATLDLVELPAEKKESIRQLLTTEPAL